MIRRDPSERLREMAPLPPAQDSVIRFPRTLMHNKEKVLPAPQDRLRPKTKPVEEADG